MKLPRRPLFTMVLILLTAGCGEDTSVESKDADLVAPQSDVSQVESQPQPLLEGAATDTAPERQVPIDPGSGVTLAEVQQSTITDKELLGEAIRLFGDVTIESLSNEVKRTLVESLVVRRRISQKQLSLMSDSEKAVVDEDVAAYKEKLLLKKYLQQFATPAAVTDEMVAEYYSTHPEEFGKTDRRYYQIVFQKETVKGNRQGVEIELVGALKTKEDFVLSANQLVAQNPNLVLKKGVLDASLFPAAVSGQMSALNVGERRFLLHSGKPFLIYLDKVETTEPLPLSRVAAKIRRKLMSVQVKEMMTTIKNQVLKDPEVSFDPAAKEWGAGSNAPE